MKKLNWTFLALILISCHPNVKKEDLTKLNGYWEINHVDMQNGDDKDYKVNETVDFFEVKNTNGFRQKVMPQFDGKFKTNGLKENIKIIEKDHDYFVEYTTSFGKWQEEIITLSDSILVLKNKDKLEYQYKRFTPFSLK